MAGGCVSSDVQPTLVALAEEVLNNKSQLTTVKMNFKAHIKQSR